MAEFLPSMMCSDIGNLQTEIHSLEEAGADRFHLDVMDGVFVPNFALGVSDVAAVCRLAQIPSEVHLMIVHPENYIHLFASTGVQIIYFHPESTYHPTTVIEKIKNEGVEPGIVLSPGVSVESVSELLHIVKYVMVMGVNPGQAGQLYLPYVDRKIDKLSQMKDEFQIRIYMDGACSEERIRNNRKKYVDGYVLGTAALFNSNGTYQEKIGRLRIAAGDRE